MGHQPGKANGNNVICTIKKSTQCKQPKLHVYVKLFDKVVKSQSHTAIITQDYNTTEAQTKSYTFK